MAHGLTPTDILGPQGRIAARLPNYEHRDEQLEMATTVAAALAEQRHLVVEAGTGVGKSFAYLIPAILATTTGDPEATPELKRVVISTHTISLQEQLLHKDIPFLNSLIPREFATALVKGRGNYLSRRRLNTARERSVSLFSTSAEMEQVQHISAWAAATHDGSLSDLSLRPEAVVWDEVASDHGNCMSRHCPHYKDCFYYRARRRMQHAQLLIVNHALFFTDLALRMRQAAILPDYDAVILDEAHTLQAVAGDHLGLSVTSGQVDYVLSRLYNDRTNRGLLVHFKMKSAEQAVDRCRSLASDFFDEVIQWRERHHHENGRVVQSEIVKNRLSPELAQLAQQVRALGKSLSDDTQRQDFQSASRRLDVLAEELDSWVKQHIEAAVYWVETRRRRTRVNVSLRAAPLDVGPTLQQHLFQKTPSVVMTSATLAVGRRANFGYFQSQIGLTQCLTRKLGSPFDFRRQAQLVVPRGMPDPGAESEDYVRMCVAMIQRYAGRTDGHAFALFTSYRMLRDVAQQLLPWAAEQNLAIYSQAEQIPRSQMLKRFCADPRAVLLGTDSFWQGVDVPGDALQTVIIARLPFSVPDRPLIAARLEAIRKAGRDPFREHQLPEAIIKLRQGFGRLIRSQRDRGQVVILDPRIRTKYYGRLFLESLPDCEIVEEAAVGDEWS